MGKPRPFVREIGHRRSARLEALEISKAAAAEEAAARAAKEAQSPREPPTDPVRRRGRKKQKCRTVEDVVVNSVETGLEEAEDDDNPNHSLFILGSQSNPPFPSPPDKRVLEFVLDMLQKHDKERIFAEPVNPLEVEHYYDIIKHPMDLSTMRTKLHEGKYDTLEQFESDVFLMSENAITFNDNSTIYYQQACDMRDLAAKIFRSLRSHPGSCKFEEIFNRKKMSKSVSSGVKIRNEGGSSRFQESAILALPSSGKECVLSGHNGHRKNARPVSLSINSDPFAENARAPEIHLGSRGGRKSLLAEERQNACRPYASFLSKDEATASIVYNSKPATLVPVNGVNYIESLRKFAKDLGPKAQEIAEKKIRQCELREQQLQAQREVANRIHEQRQAEERQLRAKESLTQQTSIVPNVPHKFPTAPHRPAIENTSHQSMCTQTLYSNLQSRGQVNPAYDRTRLGMSSNQLPPNSPLNNSAAQFAPGEFTSALTGSLVTKVGERCVVMASTRVPPSDLGQSFLPQESNLASTRVPPSDLGQSFLPQESNLASARVPSRDPGPSFLAQESNLVGSRLPPSDPGPSFLAQERNLVGPRLPPSDPGPSFVAQQSSLGPDPSQTGHSGPVAGRDSDAVPQSWLWQAKDPSPNKIVHPMHALQVETVVDPTETGRLHSESTQNQTGTILFGNQAATWVQQPGFGAGALPGPSQLREAHLVGLSHLHWRTQMGLNQFQELAHVGSSSSANQPGPWEMQTLMEPEGGQQATNNNQAPPQMDLSHFQGLAQVGPSHLRQFSCNQTDPSSSRVRSGSWDMQGNSGFEGDQPIMTQFPDSALMGPSSSASPAVAWQMQSSGADGDHHFTGHHQLQGSLRIDPCQGLSFIDLNQLQGQRFSQTEPAQNWVHHMDPTSSEAQPGQLDIQPCFEPEGVERSRQILLNYHIGSSPDGPVDLQTHLHNQQMGSSPAGPSDLLTQLRNQQMGSSPAVSADLLNHASTMGFFNLSLVESCLRSAACRNEAAVRRELPEPREGEEAASLRRRGAAFSGGASTSQHPDPTECEFLNFLDKAQPDLALQL